MSKKLSVTVPDDVGNVIENMAIAQGNKKTSVAAFVLETAIRAGLKNGEYPEVWTRPSKGEDREDSDAIAIIRALVEDTDLEAEKVAAIAQLLDIAPHELEAKLKKENGYARTAK